MTDQAPPPSSEDRLIRNNLRRPRESGDDEKVSEPPSKTEPIMAREISRSS